MECDGDEGVAESGYGGLVETGRFELLIGGDGDGVETAELFQESFPTNRADTGDLVQLRRQEGLAAQIPVIGHGEPVGLVTNALDEMGGR